MKILQVGAEVFHADRHKKLVVAFPQFCERTEPTVKLHKSGCNWNFVY